QCVETSALDGEARGLAVPAVSDVARQPALARALQRSHHLALAQNLERAAVELDQVHVLGGQPLQAALDALEQCGGAPAGSGPTAGVAALCEEVVVPAALADRAADQDLAVLVALRGVYHVEACVERAVQQPGHRPGAHALITDLRAPETEHAGHHIGRTEPSPLHVSSIPRVE